jgi:DNA-binding transcriptional LysR family regulator
MSTDGGRSLRGINLNLLPILRELLRRRNVTAAARHLNLTQSGVSDALARLRVQFGDELLVRVGRQMVPTAFALDLAPQLEDALTATESLLQPIQFDPATNERTIRIATGDTIALAIGKGLLDRLARHAPRTTVRFVNIQSPTRADLDEGNIDFLIIPRGMIPSSVLSEDGLDRLHLYRDDCVCIARSDHPEIGETLSLELLNTLPVVAVRVDDLSYLYAALPGRRRTDQLHVPQFTLPPILVAHSDAIAMVQRHVAEWFARFLPIRILELPIPFPETEVCAFWSAYHRNDPMHKWIRDQLREIVAEDDNPWLPTPRAKARPRA